jgi:hypothetical protein
MSTVARNFATIGFKPRETMRRILDAGRDRMIIPLILLTGISFILGDSDRPSLGGLDPSKRLHFTLILCAAFAGLLIAGMLLFYLFSWAAYGIGRAMEGQGSAREVRSALAWGSVPFIWALLYRIPVAIWLSGHRTEVGPGTRFTFNPGLASKGCLAAILFGVLELAVLIWYLVVVSKTLGEAHRFSGWRGLATLLLTAATPIVIGIAAFLAT